MGHVVSINKHIALFEEVLDLYQEQKVENLI